MSYFDPGSAAANAERTGSGSFSTSGEYTDAQAQAGAEASAALSDEPLNPNAGIRDKVLRYPYARIENESDYLRIEIAEFTPPKLNLDNFIGTEGSDDTISLKGGNENPKANFQLTTISETVGNRIEALRNLKNVKHTILLPIPEQISDTTQISWGEGTLNPAEAFGISFGNDFFKEPTDALGNALKLITTGVGGLANNPQLQRAIQNALSATAVGALGGNVSANQLIARATGQVFNPNLELLFDGVGLRNFQFNFDFFPRNKKEAEEVVLIIRTLKKRMSANRNASGNSTIGGVFISAPHIFQLTYMKGNKVHPVLNRFLPMALVDLKVNYTGSNTYSTFWDGTPTHMQLSLAFKELNPIYSEDYDNTDPKSVGY